MSEKLLLIDGHSILNRAFYGLPDLTNSKGQHTNAVYGFLNILFKIMEEEEPQYLAVAFDLKAPTFRHKMFDGYKGTRKPMDERLREQVPLMKEMLVSMGVPIVELAGYEADDLLGTLSVLGEKAGMEVSILSGDRDLLQLATDHVQIRIPKTKKTGTEIENYYASDVAERYLVTPKEFIDVKALMGDTSDNIPGVEGIGEKTAMNLIAAYHSIEEVHAHAAEVKPPRAAKNIIEFWDQAVMSKTLATIITDAPVMEEVGFTFEKAHLKEGMDSLYTTEAYQLCKELEFKNLLSRFDRKAPEDDIADHFVRVTDEKTAARVFDSIKGREAGFCFLPSEEDETTQEADGQFCLFAVPSKETLLGVAIACGDEISYLTTEEGLSSQKILELFQKAKPKRWLAVGLKEQLAILGLREVTAGRDLYFDAEVASYLLNPLKGAYPYEDIAKDTTGALLPSAKELEYDPMLQACYTAYTAVSTAGVLEEQLREQGMEELFWKIEMPLVFVLYDMEAEGICVDAAALEEYGKRLVASIDILQQKIYEEAGEEFNINSPKQLGIILFEKLALPGAKKTKTGYSTSADVLEKMEGEYPIVADILEYRRLTKLKSTYADGLQAFIDPQGRIHTTFHQTITATGRLSSSDPNLQNIPIRMELGRLIRRVFHPKAGDLFVDSDYSQIELRVLAHMSGDEKLIAAYNSGQDIHSTTASQVFNVPLEEVTPQLRRNAKAVNFGIVYGISDFGLSQDLGISQKEAKEYIDRYFATYPKIKTFIDETVEAAKTTGKTTTLFGRIRPIPELSSSNYMQRQFGERVAMNAPIQGTAADIIKIAMIRVHDRLIREGYQSRLILQVHDELLIETRQEEKEAVIALLEEEMHGAADLAVALEVGTAWGDNWYDAH